jgi:tetratricopeptide (TPR) repeat protein
LRYLAWAVAIVCAWGMAGFAVGQKPAEAVAVEPAELERRPDLIGRLVIVDDHVKYYVARTGSEPDELQLKRTPITFQVPRGLRPQASTRITFVVVRGVLARDEGRLVCQVSELKPVSSDLDRLERGLASLAPNDVETRKAWALWAERRASDFKDEALLNRAKIAEGEALRLQSQMKRVGVDAPAEWLATAQEARRRKVPESESGAMGHRAFRAKLAAATSEAALKSIIEEIEAFFPGVAADKDSGRINLARSEAAYVNDPAGTYRESTAHDRKGFDRLLWADATVRVLDIQAAQDLQAAIAVAERSTSLVPERPNLAGSILEKATRAARQEVGTLRLSEVKALAAAIRERLRQPDEAVKVLAEWLKIQRDRLSSTDAEGPVDLANLYEELIDDHVTSVELLRKAWRIDPNSKVIAEALRSRGFRKVKDDWVESAPATPVNRSAGAGINDPPVVISSQGLLGLTADEVTARLAVKPNRVNFIGSQGQLIEQRIYHLDTKRVRYVNLLLSAGELKRRVIADYTLPSSSMKGGLGPAR